jgi:hypothetical protein
VRSARAPRRAGELLKEIEKAQGANQNIKGGASPNVRTRKQAAADAGLSPDQAKDVVRVANMPDPLMDPLPAQIRADCLCPLRLGQVGISNEDSPPAVCRATARGLW